MDEVIQAYRMREEAFFRTLAGEPNVDDLFLYGEVAFCLFGLKPCVLVDHPSAWMSRYVAAVVEGTPGIEQLRVTSKASDAMALRGMLVLLNPSHAMAAEARHVFLQPHVDESQLACVLDYPGRLPAGPHELASMREVAYVCQGRLLTTYAAQAAQIDAVQRHFARYRDQWVQQCSSQGDLHLIFRLPR